MRSTPGSRAALLATLVAAALLLGTGLGASDLWAPDEPRYAQIAEEMRSGVHGVRGFVLLHLNGEPYSQKPPLYYWLAAAFGSPAGRVSETAARLPSALAGIGCVAVTAWLGRGLFPGTQAGVWAAALLLTLPRFAHQARRAQLDVLLAFFEGLALLAFWQLESQPEAAPQQRRRWLAGFHAALGLAALTKGPVGWLPLLSIAVYLAWRGRLRDLRSLLPAWGLALSVAPLLAWAAAASLIAPPGWLGEAVVDNVLARFATGTAHVRPFYYFAYQLPLDFLPWTLLWPAAAVAAVRALRAPYATGPGRADPMRLLLACLAAPLVFFSLSAGKRGLYLLPTFPVLALLCAAGVDAALRERGRLPRGLPSVLALVVGVPGLAALAWQAGLLQRSMHTYASPAPAALFGIATISALGLAIALAARSQRVRFASVVAAIFALEAASFHLLFPSLDPEKSPRPLAEAAAAETAAGEAIAVYRENALAGGIAYYARRRVLPLETLDGVDSYLASGGRIVIAGVRQREELEGIVRFEVRQRARSGGRELLLLRPRAEGSEPAGRPDASPTPSPPES